MESLSVAPLSRISRAEPTSIIFPATVPVTPLPLMALTFSAAATRISFASAARTMARAMGCSLRCSIALAVSKSSRSLTPSAVNRPTICGRPLVSVPVLSSAMARRMARPSKCKPPLINTPDRAARATPERTAAGVLMASAHGLAPTSIAMARSNDSSKGSHPKYVGMTSANTVPTTTQGTYTRVNASAAR